MQALFVLAAVIAVASAGGITGYSTGNYVQHAHAVHAVAGPAIAAPVAYGGLGAVAYAQPIAKAVAPVAQSNQFVNRAPAARVLAAPVAYAAAPALAAPVAYGGPVGYAAPALLG